MGPARSHCATLLLDCVTITIPLWSLTTCLWCNCIPVVVVQQPIAFIYNYVCRTSSDREPHKKELRTAYNLKLWTPTSRAVVRHHNRIHNCNSDINATFVPLLIDSVSMQPATVWSPTCLVWGTDILITSYYPTLATSFTLTSVTSLAETPRFSLPPWDWARRWWREWEVHPVRSISDSGSTVTVPSLHSGGIQNLNYEI